MYREHVTVQHISVTQVHKLHVSNVSLSLNLRDFLSSLLLLYFEVSWSLKAQSAVFLLLRIAQTSCKAGKVQSSCRWPELIIHEVLSSPHDDRSWRLNEWIQIYWSTPPECFFFPFLSAFPEALRVGRNPAVLSCRSGCQTPGGDVSSQSAGAAALLQSWNTGRYKWV